MKIGILTVPFNNNYGGFLQAFALKRVLMDMGHKVIFINRRRNRPNKMKNRIYRLLVKWHLKKDPIAVKQEQISVHTNRFKSQYLAPITNEFYTTRQLERCLKQRFDCIIVGSDQVWRYRYAEDSIDDFFCNFLRGRKIPHFSYAASMGTDEMEYPQDKLEVCKELLKDFSSISVREESAARILYDYFGALQVVTVLDPTLLLNRDVYINLFRDKYEQEKNPYILTYILDEDEVLSKEVSQFASEREILVVSMKAETGDLFSLDVLQPVECWLASIYNARYVITDSYHGTVFSIIFHKPFLVVNNTARGTARLKNLLNRLHLEERLVATTNGIREVMNRPIDWTTVENSLRQEKEKSLAFLESSLKIIKR